MQKLLQSDGGPTTKNMAGDQSIWTTSFHRNQVVGFLFIVAFILMISAVPSLTITVAWLLNEFYDIPVDVLDMTVPDFELNLWSIFFAEPFPGLIMFLVAVVLPLGRMFGILVSLSVHDRDSKIYWYELTERFAKWTMHDCACVALWMMFGSFDMYEIFDGFVHPGFYMYTWSVILFWGAYAFMRLPSGYDGSRAVSSGQSSDNEDRNTKIGLALTVIALLLLTPAWTLSLAVYESTFWGYTEQYHYSILDSIIYCWQDPDGLASQLWVSQLIAVMIFVYSILIPVVKMVLLLLVFTPQFQCFSCIRNNRYSIFNFVRTIGKWSITDPLCAAFYNGFYIYDGDGDIQLNSGVEIAWYLFIIYVLVSLAALQLFPDPPQKRSSDRDPLTRFSTSQSYDAVSRLNTDIELNDDSYL